MGKKRFIIGLSAILLGIIVACGIAFFSINHRASAPHQPARKTDSVSKNDGSLLITPEKGEAYTGEETAVANAFTINVPNGWYGSSSSDPSFTAIMFARPNELQSLRYDSANKPRIDTSGIASWNGLTEHFFALAPTISNQFDPGAHQEVTMEPFTFNDGTVGQKYYVVKHADEAKKWGGLQRDTEWQGRTYIYERDGKRVEAHLALYPSSTIDIPFYESVIRSIHLP